MKITDIQTEEKTGFFRLSAHVSFESRPELNQRCWIEWPMEYAAEVLPRLDPFAVFAVPLAGVLYEPLVSEYSVSYGLYHNLNEAGGVFEAYFPDKYRRMPVELPCEDRPPPEKGQTASFYSGGIDSLYNIALTEERMAEGKGLPLDEVWLVHGFDVRLDQEELWHVVEEKLVKDGQQLLRPKIVTVRTNIKEIYDRCFQWPDLGFGAALAALAKSRSAAVDRVLIGSSSKYGESLCLPHASTPLVDPLWSCERQEIVHFSALVDREEKIEKLKTRPDLLSLLRVCWLNPGNTYNCGQCEKCLRTRLQMMVLDIAEPDGVFACPLEPRMIAKIRLPWARKSEYVWNFWLKIKVGLSRRTDHRPIYKAIRKSLFRSRLYWALRLIPEPLVGWMKKHDWVHKWKWKLGI